MDLALERRKPIWRELIVDGRAFVTQVLSIGQLASLERGVSDIVGYTQLRKWTSASSTGLRYLTYRGQAELRERNVEARDRQEGCVASLLVLLDGSLVAGDLRGSRDLRNQQAKLLAEASDVVDLEEHGRLQLLCKTDTMDKQVSRILEATTEIIHTQCRLERC